jgi:hypothetical protein
MFSVGVRARIAVVAARPLRTLYRPTLVAVWREICTAPRIVKFTARAVWFRKKHREEDSPSQKVL